MFKVPEQYRIKHLPDIGFKTDGNNGAFEIPLSNRSIAYVLASDNGQWEHVSVHIVSDNKQRIPTWNEMCKIKDIFWGENDCVVQFHPPKSEYVNLHKHVLHLWRHSSNEYLRPNNFFE